MAPSNEAQEAPRVSDSVAGFHNSRVLRVYHWNSNLFSFTITRPLSFRFHSGQFVMIGLPSFPRPLLRAYSIASPFYAGELEFLSIKVPGGQFTSLLQNINPGDQVLLGRKTVGTLILDALRPGRRLFFFATGTGLAPFLSLARDPDTYDKYEELVLVHCVRYVSDLAYRDTLAGHFANDILIHDLAINKFTYLPTVTRDDFPQRARVTYMIEHGIPSRNGTAQLLDPANDRVMICGSIAMIENCRSLLESRRFVEGSVDKPGEYVFERAFAT
ncbi:MAG: ferredoxin--NADP reductase [Hyphomicrobiales bacterium]|nr:MAG: ferredoxin--NADP reductase [Hyphomicrobiales bacterium]